MFIFWCLKWNLDTSCLLKSEGKSSMADLKQSKTWKYASISRKSFTLSWESCRLRRQNISLPQNFNEEMIDLETLSSIISINYCLQLRLLIILCSNVWDKKTTKYHSYFYFYSWDSGNVGFHSPTVMHRILSNFWNLEDKRAREKWVLMKLVQTNKGI